MIEFTLEISNWNFGNQLTTFLELCEMRFDFLYHFIML